MDRQNVAGTALRVADFETTGSATNERSGSAIDRHGEWRRGWPVVAAAVGGMMTVAAPTAIIGLVMAQLQESFGWSRAQIVGGLVIVSLCALFLAPVAGRIIARYGARPVALVGFATAALGFVVVALSGPGIVSWFVAWVAFGTLSIILGPITWSLALSSIFDRHRGLALSIALSGSGFAFAIWPPLVIPIVAHFSWRGAFFLVAAVAVLVLLPISLVALRGLSKPGRGSSVHHAAAGDASGPWGLTLAEAMRTSRFWRLTLAMLLAAGVEGSLLVHFYPILIEQRFAPADAAYLTALTGPAMIAGRIVAGWLMDRVFAPFVAGGFALLPAVTCFVLMGSPSLASATAGALALGVGVGTATCSGAYIVGRYFGLRDYASIFGVLIGLFGVAFGTIPVLSGHVYDVAKSYAPLFPVLILAIAPAALLFATLGRYPAPAAPRA